MGRLWYLELLSKTGVLKKIQRSFLWVVERVTPGTMHARFVSKEVHPWAGFCLFPALPFCSCIFFAQDQHQSVGFLC